MSLRLEERTIILHSLPQVRRILNPHLFEPDGNKIRAEFLTVKLHGQEPVFFIRIGDRAIDTEVTRPVIMRQKLLYFKIIRLIQSDELCIRQFDFSVLNLLLEIPVLVVPEDDPALIELRKRSSKPAV